MPKIGSWGGHNFEVKKRLVRGFTDLTVKGGSETENKTNNKQQFAARKAGKPLEIGMTVVLDSRLGVDAQADALKLIDQARNGHKSYFYLDGRKLTPCQLMLTSASADNILLTASGEWISAEVKLTLVQCSKNDGTAGTTSSGGGGGGGKSQKISATKTPAKPANPLKVIADKTKQIAQTANKVKDTLNAMKTTQAVKTAQAAVNQLINSAKKAPAPAKPVMPKPTLGGGGGAGKANNMTMN